jgi:hypothetical protein
LKFCFSCESKLVPRPTPFSCLTCICAWLRKIQSMTLTTQKHLTLRLQINIYILFTLVTAFMALNAETRILIQRLSWLIDSINGSECDLQNCQPYHLRPEWVQGRNHTLPRIFTAWNSSNSIITKHTLHNFTLLNIDISFQIL